MGQIILRAASFMAVILLGVLLRRGNILRQEDFRVLSTLVLKVTLPAATIVNFASRRLEVSMLALPLLGLLCAGLYMGVGYFSHRRGTAEEKAFAVINYSSYNIGNFTLPFVQSFLGATGVVTTLMFDAGNAIICLGGSAAVASVVLQGGRLSLKGLLRRMGSSISFMTCVVMMLLALLGISLPEAVVQVAEVPASANAFLSMLMIGVGIKPVEGGAQRRYLVRHLLTRYGVAAILAVVLWFCLPFDAEVRKVLVVLMFAPVASANVPFTQELGGDVSLASAISTISIICSICFIVTLLCVLP